ncbi:hypothetical protein Lal_00039696 [Lupinus albus]|nr:hypothetical protein Lal_00039696 [Lupinus albus]
MQLGSKEFMVVINCTRPCWVPVIAPKHPYNTRLQSKIMSDSDSSSQDSRSELAELKAQMKEMTKMIQGLQKA